MAILPTTQPAAAPTVLPTPVGQTTNDPAQMAANRAATVAGSNGLLKEVNGQVVSASSTLANLSTAPQSDKASPAGSATGPQNLAGMNAINGTTTAPQPTTPKITPDSLVSSISSMYSGTGQSINSNNLISEINSRLANGETIEAINAEMTSEARQDVDLITRANKATSDAQAKQDQLYRDQLAQQNATYAAANTKLAAEREAAIHSGIAQAAQHGMFEDQGSDSIQYGVAIGRSYDKLQFQLDQQAEDAKSALAQGNDKAYADIQSNMQATLEKDLSKTIIIKPGVKISDKICLQFEGY